uniref:NADH-ubiquinone oxidoreductase chain 4 n=1 Tax=Megalodontes quinquecinctus TaxID=2491145 RepID=A0A3Q8UA58_9HYME|nr:NADH dehydrogenase subunit 4 [Megalodontes quinquecinctus]
MMMMKYLFMILGFFMLFYFKLTKMMNLFQNLFMIMIMLMFLDMSLSENFKMLGYNMGLDLLSFWMVILSIWVSFMMLLSSYSIEWNNYFKKWFILIIIFMLLLLLLTFSSMNLFMMYIYFESTLIPMFLLILGWGYQPERIQSGLYLLFYTLFMSLPMMLGIFYIYYNEKSLMIYLLVNYNNLSIMLYWVMMLAFLVKMPMYLFHLWLPKAHVEAPVSGSMMLAGVMLKLGGYGILRIMPMMLNMKFMNFIIIINSMLGGLIISLVCLIQVDMKSLIAYSSIVHMGLILSGMLTLFKWGFVGSLILMIGHGLCSSGLFYLSGVLYERTQSRSLFINKGMMNFMPSMSMWWFLMSIINMAAPPSLNLLSEIMLICSLLSWSWILVFNLMMISFFSAVYMLYLYTYSQHGEYYSGKFSYIQNYVREFLLIIFHWFPLNVLILKMDMFSF